jgi:hypothetical protein
VLNAAESIPQERGLGNVNWLLLRRLIRRVRIVVHREAHRSAGVVGKLDDDVIRVREEQIGARRIAMYRDVVLVQVLFPAVDGGGIVDEEADVIEGATGFGDRGFYELRRFCVREFEECEDGVWRNGDEVVPLGFGSAHPVRHGDLGAEHIPIKRYGLLHVVGDERDVMEHAERAVEAVAIGQGEIGGGCHGWNPFRLIRADRVVGPY